MKLSAGDCLNIPKLFFARIMKHHNSEVIISVNEAIRSLWIIKCSGRFRHGKKYLHVLALWFVCSIRLYAIIAFCDYNIKLCGWNGQIRKFFFPHTQPCTQQEKIWNVGPSRETKRKKEKERASDRLFWFCALFCWTFIHNLFHQISWNIAPWLLLFYFIFF